MSAAKAPKIKTITNLEAGECRWPIGDPRQPGFHFCGAQQTLGRPYCIQHWQLSFIPGKSRHGAQAQQLTITAPTASPALSVRRAA